MLLTGVVALVGGTVAAPIPDHATAKVVVDPDSPSGKEYAIPLEEARREAGGDMGRQADEGTAETAPLFGVGVGGGGGAAGPSESAERARESGNGAPDMADQAAGNSSGRSPDIPLVIPNVGDGYPAISMVGLVAAVVLVGLGFGLVLKRTQRFSGGS